MAVETPYVDAIQAIPGNTPGEKFRWIAMLVKERMSECNSLEEVVETEKIPRLLMPLVQIQAAIMLNKKNREDQSSYGAIAEGLKSKDKMVVNKALEAKCFFDGSNKTITNVQYFFENLFPYVSLNTRTRIIKKLATHLALKDPALAEHFFSAVASTYGLEQALPLLLACNETFMYDTIVERRIVLGRKHVKSIFRKNPDFVVRYFRLSKPSTDPYERNLHPVNVYDFGDFLAALIKKRIEAFVELYEMHENVPPSVTLSNKCAETFLKNGKEYLQRKPKLYINLLPLRLISASRMEAIFSKLFPDNIKEFKTDPMLEYLKYYPQEKKVDLFLKSYREVYGKNLLDDSSNVTPTLLKLLPAEERIKQARIKLASETVPDRRLDYLYTWICYLPTEESIPQLKEEVAKTPEMEYRTAMLCQMIYSCRINNDDQALLNVLTYIRDRHKNEQCWLTMKVFECLLALYELPQASEDHWTVLMDMIVRAHVKDHLLPSNCVSVKIVEAAIHFKIIHSQPIDQLIGMLVDLKSMRCTGYWNILTNYPEYERMCLEACLNAVSQRYDSDKTPWREDKVGILYDVCSSIYHFNEMHVNRNSRIERMSIKNYPWIVEKIREILTTDDQNNYYVYIIENFKNMLRTHENELYKRFSPTEGEDKIAEVETGNALKLLRKSPESILARWKEYLKKCQINWYYEHTKRFVRATRWYKEIPVRFVEQCLQDLTSKKEGVCLDILATLVHGETFTKIVEPLLPASKAIDIHHKEAKQDYDLIHHVVTSTKIANPPIPLQLVGKLCEGDYLSKALVALISVCRRTLTMDVIAFARTLASQRVSVRKHGIRLMCMVAARDQLQQFLLSQWKDEEHYSIRDVLFSKGRQLFKEEPGAATWSLLVQMISTLTIKDETAIGCLTQMLHSVPNEYVVDYMKLLLKTIDKFADDGVQQYKIVSYISDLLGTINAAICNLLPEEFTEELLRRFLFNSELEISRAAGMFVITAHLLPAKDKLDQRMKVFSTIFVEVVKNGWNVPHPRKSRFYPVNHMVNQFIDELTHTILYVDMNPQLIDGILNTFLSVLTPQMDATSYLLLVFAKEHVSVKSPKEFGIRIGRKMPELVKIFSPVFIFFVSSVLQYLLGLYAFKDYDKEDTNLSVIEGLMEVGLTEATLVAVKLLTPIKTRDYWDRYDKLMMKFTEYDHPAIKSIACDIINKTSFEDACDM